MGLVKTLKKIPYLGLLTLPGLSWLTGVTFNKVCIAANGGLMPVQEYGCHFEPTLQHICMTPSSHLKILADWIYFAPWAVHMSPGDILMYAGESTVWYALVSWCALMIRDYNKGDY